MCSRGGRFGTICIAVFRAAPFGQAARDEARVAY